MQETFDRNWSLIGVQVINSNTDTTANTAVQPHLVWLADRPRDDPLRDTADGSANDYHGKAPSTPT